MRKRSLRTAGRSPSSPPGAVVWRGGGKEKETSHLGSEWGLDAPSPGHLRPRAPHAPAPTPKPRTPAPRPYPHPPSPEPCPAPYPYPPSPEPLAPRPTPIPPIPDPCPRALPRLPNPQSPTAALPAPTWGGPLSRSRRGWQAPRQRRGSGRVAWSAWVRPRGRPAAVVELTAPRGRRAPAEAGAAGWQATSGCGSRAAAAGWLPPRRAPRGCRPRTG